MRDNRDTLGDFAEDHMAYSRLSMRKIFEFFTAVHCRRSQSPRDCPGNHRLADHGRGDSASGETGWIDLPAVGALEDAAS